MNVLFLTGEYPPQRGGIADHTRGLALALAEHGWQPAVLTSSRAATPDSRQPGQPDQVFARVPAWNWSLFRQVRDTLNETRADVLHIQFQTGAFAMHPAVNLLPWRLRRSAVPVVTTMHDLRAPYLFPKAGLLRPWVNCLLMRRSAAVIVTNPQDWQQASKTVHPDRLHLVPLANQFPPCLPPAYDRQIFRHHNGLDGRFVVAHFGMLNHSKGAGTLIQAAARLRDEGVAATLVFAGEAEGSSDPTNAAEAARLRQLVAQLGLTEFVIYTGYLAPADVSAWLSAADAAALPFTDGASYRRTSMLAALAHGLPLVTTEPEPAMSDGGLPRLRDGVNCLLVPRGNRDGDAAALAARLASLHEQPALARRIGAEGQTVAAYFSWPRVARATAEVYASVVGKRHDLS